MAIEATLFSTSFDPEIELMAERDENTCRKDFTPSEAVAMGKAIEEAVKEEARKRKREGKSEDGLAGGAGRKNLRPIRTKVLIPLPQNLGKLLLALPFSSRSLIASCCLFFASSRSDRRGGQGGSEEAAAGSCRKEMVRINFPMSLKTANNSRSCQKSVE